MFARILAAATLAALTAAPGAVAADDPRNRVEHLSGHRVVTNVGDGVETRVEHRFTLARPTVVSFGYLGDLSIDVKGRYRVSADAPGVSCTRSGRFGGDQGRVAAQWRTRRQLVLGFTAAIDDDCGPFSSATIVPLGGEIDVIRMTRAQAESKRIRLTARVADTLPLGDMTSTADMKVTIVLRAI